MKAYAASCVLIILVLVLPTTAQAEIVPNAELSAYATRIAGTGITTYCVSPEEMPDGAEGYVGISTSNEGTTVFPEIYMDGSICGLARLALNYFTLTRHVRAYADSDGVTQDIALALLAIRHEVEHVVLQSGNEGLVECTAVRNVWNDIVPLFPLVKAREVYKRAREWHLLAPPVYRTVC